MQRNNQGERCKRLSSAQQHASECEGLSALRVFLDWCTSASAVLHCDTGPQCRQASLHCPALRHCSAAVFTALASTATLQCFDIYCNSVH